MNEQNTEEVTFQNELYVEQWFKSAGFASDKLDKKTSAKSADWHFHKPGLSIICEVKTIFSGGQTGSTREQYERSIQKARNNLERAKQSVPPGTTLVVGKDELDFALGKIPYQKQPIYREYDHTKFCNELKQTLEGDNRIAHLPFDLTLSFSSFYVEHNLERRKAFLEWLIGFVLWASEIHLTDIYPFGMSDATFTLKSAQLHSDGQRTRSVRAHAIVTGPLSSGGLKVGFMTGASGYNEQGILELIQKAMSQLHATRLTNTEANQIRVIAFWSQSSNIGLFRFAFELESLEKGEVADRYYAFDWAFKDYPQLAAIIFFELRDLNPENDIFNGVFAGKPQLFPFGFVITNPNYPDAELILKQAIPQHFYFMRGISLDSA